jgi:hypothetical protein
LAAPHLHGVLVLVTGNKFIAGVVVTGDNCSPMSTLKISDKDKFFAGVVDTAEQLITGDKHSFANMNI